MPDGTGSFLSARTLAEEPNFSGESQRWHVIGSDGVMARETGDPNSDVVAVLPFACMLTVTAKQGDRVKIISPVSGWVPVADSVGYVLLAKGGADVGKRWRYRVVYRKGAIVRHGIELDSPIVFSMPSHSVVEVLERRINDVGLPRLRIAEGWISEVLNPFAWEEGPVVEILRLLQPLRYRVVRLDGALVTRTVELGSSQVKTIGCGHDVLVVAKKFSDRGNRCIPRLQLADGSGWISLRLTKEPREDSAVVEYIGVGEPNLSAMPMPLAPANLEAPPGPVPMPDPPVPEPADETGVTVDLPKIKNGGLTEDDKCPVCITRSQQQEPGNEGATHREERIAGSSFAPRTTALPPTTYKGPPTMAVTDHDALVALYDATDGPNWQDSSDWGTDADLSDWYGVKVNDQGLVVQLHLSCNKIPRGQIPPQLGGLGALKILSFYTNKLDGHIPSDLGNLSALQLLDLSHNQLSGAIPTQFGDLSKLTSLRLSKNQLSGSIPPELGKLAALEELDLSSNQLNDLIPPELGNLEDLSKLRLDVNQLTGTIPEELGKLTALRTLFLNGNNLSGPIPKELGALSELEMLELNDNQLTGSIPAALGALNKLESLSLHNNELAGNPGSLKGARLSRWLEQLKGSRLHRPWAISVVDFLVELWHFLIPIFDDVTDVILLVATFEVRGALWWTCVGAFVVAELERMVLLLVALCLLLCWIPFALVDAESREGLFRLPLKVLNGWDDLQLEEELIGFMPSRYALRWPILDAVTWAGLGSRSKSSSLMRLCGLQGNTPIETLERSGFGLSLINKIVKYHPYSILGGAIFFCPYGHRLPGDGIATRRSGVMLRAVGETMVVDSLFLALSLSSEPWEEGLSIGIYSLIFSVFELLTELQYYAAEAEAGMTMGEEEAELTSIEEPIQGAPAV